MFSVVHAGKFPLQLPSQAALEGEEAERLAPKLPQVTTKLLMEPQPTFMTAHV